MMFDKCTIKPGCSNGTAASGGFSWSKKRRILKLTVIPDFFFFPLADFICLDYHNKMSCAEICGVQKYFSPPLPFPSLSSVPFTVCHTVVL